MGDEGCRLSECSTPKGKACFPVVMDSVQWPCCEVTGYCACSTRDSNSARGCRQDYGGVGECMSHGSAKVTSLRVLMAVDIKKGDFGVGRRKVALVRRITREFQVRQANGLDDDLIGVDVGRSFEAFGSGTGDVVVLIHTITAYA